jgi:dTDP-4-amino-4,6-dideoxy-D-galactose acyltransferase
MSTASPEPCRLLSWDTNFFQFPIGRVEADAMDDARALEIEEWTRTHPVRCLYFLARADQPETVRAAEKHGFRLMDIRVTLERKLNTPVESPTTKAPYDFRAAAAEDVPKLQAIAATAHTDTRFFKDGIFPREKTEALYAQWIQRECQGEAQQVIVATQEQSPIGYVSCHLAAGQGEGSIGLLAAAEKHQRRGIGHGLIVAGLHWFQSKGAACVSVVTQGGNASKVRIYERCGFVTRQVQLWYHKWYAAADRMKK